MFLYVDPEYDTSPHDRDDPPARPYVVCATPRCGSNLLCWGLTSTGLVGSCLEYFNPKHRAVLERRWGRDGSLASYARAIYGRRTTEAGYVGVKLHWDQVYRLRGETLGTAPLEPEFGVSSDFLERLLPGARYVRVLRQDVNRQAVSYWLAHVTGTWVELDGRAPRLPHRPPAYSFEGIERCRRLLENGELHWDRFLRANGIEPLVVVYERLAEEWEGTIRAVVRHLRPEAEVPECGPPGIRRQSDDLTEEMLERFARDRAERPLPEPEPGRSSSLPSGE